tara:strand:+ start:581 stop:823 length:243 start_codon:yes stop_codon:yes gene_type:complete
MAEMAGELLQAKMDSARKDSQMTHMMRVGTFQLELVPDKSISVDKVFHEMLDKLMDKYGDKLLEVTVAQIQNPEQGRHYG